MVFEFRIFNYYIKSIKNNFYLIIKGFSLIELLIAVAILGIISTIGVTTYKGYINNAKIEEAKVSLYKIQMMQESYLLENNLSKYWNTGNNCSDKSSTIESTLFNSNNILNVKSYYFCIEVFESSGYKAKAISLNNLSSLWLDHKNNKSWE